MFSKNDQLHKSYKIHRDPERLRQLLGVLVPTSKEHSEARRYGKCEHPKCGNVGTIDRPLDLHHIVPRSQAKYLINEYVNHLYLCGDLFRENHHKALHGESTIGLKDWKTLGFFGDWDAETPCEDPPPLDDAVGRLLELARADQICRSLLAKDPVLAFDYAKRKSIFPPNGVLSSEDISKLLRH